MPVVRPLPIDTKDAGYLKALWIWLFTVRRWLLTEDWHFTLKSGREIKVPSGFIFDGASVPKIFWFLLSPTGILLIPGILHDYAYKFGYLIVEIGDGETRRIWRDRDYWDRFFREVAITVNGFRFINWVAYFALKYFGWVAWNKHRKAEKKYRKQTVI